MGEESGMKQVARPFLAAAPAAPVRAGGDQGLRFQGDTSGDYRKALLLLCGGEDD